MEKLKEQNCELSNIEITDGNIKSFEKYARKYNVDYCLKKRPFFRTVPLLCVF